jgi:thiamine transport system ATP-binding protein
LSEHDIYLNSVQFAFEAFAMNFDLSVSSNTINIVTGPSGAGKSTLLNLIAGFETPLSGTIELMGNNVTHAPPPKRPIAMLFQEHNVFPHLSIKCNVSLGVRSNLKLTEFEKALVDDALLRVGLLDKSKRLPSQLSGGERQRIAIARILVQNKPILLLDEPFASLGPSLRQEMIELLTQLRHEKNLTILAVTHHPNEWKNSAEQFIFVNNGHIHAQGMMQDLNFSHDNDMVQSYLGV